MKMVIAMLLVPILFSQFNLKILTNLVNALKIDLIVKNSIQKHLIFVKVNVVMDSFQ